jgi:hypothetical protein
MFKDRHCKRTCCQWGDWPKPIPRDTRVFKLKGSEGAKGVFTLDPRDGIG